MVLTISTSKELTMLVVVMKYIVCFSGGHSSAIAAIECVRKAGKENVILLLVMVQQYVLTISRLNLFIDG